LQGAQEHNGDSVSTFKPGRLPALWQDFQGLLALCPEQRLELTTPPQEHQVYRWVNGLEYTDSEGRKWTFRTADEITSVPFASGRAEK
jgi:hypothetical protein